MATPSSICSVKFAPIYHILLQLPFPRTSRHEGGNPFNQASRSCTLPRVQLMRARQVREIPMNHQKPKLKPEICQTQERKTYLSYQTKLNKQLKDIGLPPNERLFLMSLARHGHVSLIETSWCSQTYHLHFSTWEAFVIVLETMPIRHKLLVYLNALDFNCIIRKGMSDKKMANPTGT